MSAAGRRHAAAAADAAVPRPRRAARGGAGGGSGGAQPALRGASLRPAAAAAGGAGGGDAARSPGRAGAGSAVACVPVLLCGTALYSHPWAAARGLRVVRDAGSVHDASLQVEVRNRPRLPWSDSPGHGDGFPDHIRSPTTVDFVLPVVASGITDPADAGRRARELLDRTLARHSAVLFRGLPIRSAADFHAFNEALGWATKLLGGGGTYRTTLVGRVRTASNEPGDQTIEPHTDMAHNPPGGYPTRQTFLMLEAPAPGMGGEPVLADARGVTAELRRAGIVRLFEQHGGVAYNKILWSNKTRSDTFTWQSRYFTSDRDAVTKEITDLGCKDWAWDKDDTLRYAFKMPVLRTHPVTKEEVWFNGVHTNHRSYYDDAAHIDTSRGSPMDTSFADGTPISDRIIERIRSAVWNNSYAFRMEDHDVTVVDTMLTWHGRMSWEVGNTSRVMLTSHFHES